MLGERLFLLRTQNGMSQIKLADILGKSKQSISNWENNNILPSIDMLVKLSDIFQVSTDYLLELDGRRKLDVTGLTDEQLEHIQLIINDMRN